MAHPAVADRIAEPHTPSSAAPWYIWCLLAAVTSNIAGVFWDIAWHRSIGRDEFWTPAHVLIYLCGVLAGIACGYLILRATFEPRGELAAASVRVLGFRGPLGAFVAAWGGIAMLVSAPFDDWWHNAYGLDVKVLSPPHVVLGGGMIAVCAGTLLLILGFRNRAAASGDRARVRVYEWMFLYVGGLLVTSLQLLTVELTYRTMAHSGKFFRTVALTAPILLIGIAGSLPRRWGATTIAGIYTLLWCAQLWILPLGPAEPKLGPVYVPVTHFIPLDFPLLLLPAAAAVDMVRGRLRDRGVWVRSIAVGLTFLAVFFLVQWPFSNFYLKSEWARNWFFGAHYQSYSMPPESYSSRGEFYPADGSTTGLLVNMLAAGVLSVLTVRAGYSWAGWMRQVRR